MTATRAERLELIDDSLCDLVMEAHRYATDPAKREALKKHLGGIIDNLRAWREEPQPTMNRDELARKLAGAGGYSEESWVFLKRPGSIADHHLISEAYRRADIAIAEMGAS